MNLMPLSKYMDENMTVITDLRIFESKMPAANYGKHY